MVEIEPTDSPVARRHTRPIGRWLRLVAPALIGFGLVVALSLGAIWYRAIVSSLAARWLRIHVFHVLFAAYLTALILVPFGLIGSLTIGWLARRAGNRRRTVLAGRALLVCLGLLIGIGICESVCAWQLRERTRLVHLSTPLEKLERPQTSPTPEAPGPTAIGPERSPGPLEPRAPGRPIDVVTIGESSARGVPFASWLSLDRIITWQLGRAFPEEAFRADNRAIPGITLERAIEQLAGLERRPDLLIVYAGHNEFQSRFGWGRKAPHYRFESKVGPLTWTRQIRNWSLAAEFFGRNADRLETEIAPPPRYERDPADSPCCTPDEYAYVLTDYRRRLDGLLRDCEFAGIPTLVVVPPSNDGAFDPNHSILPPDTSPDEQRDFIKRLNDARRAESADRTGAVARYRRLVAEQPGFAEAHYRLAQALESAGSFDEARSEYIRARELDGVPFRCPAPFLEACRELGERHRSIVVDAPRLLAQASPHGIVDDRLMSDAHHPGLNAFVIMARDALRQLKERGVFGWPRDVPAPTFTLAECAAHFKLDTRAWIEVCEGSRTFYKLTALLPRDPSWRDSVVARYSRAIEFLQAGKSPDETGIPSLKIREELFAFPGRTDATPIP